ncbi:MAG: class I SAM-dependent methyltransferase [Verrucomicrobia bacterium]|nr:class I SAM-dependent methyltransferase [Verrucomicrobiota bacterium]
MDKLVTTSEERFWHSEAFARDQWVKTHAERLAPKSVVLDAGAGASKYRPLFAHCDYKTQDFCKYDGPLVKYLRPIDYVCEITAIPLPDQSLDAILCTEVFEHVVNPMAVLTEFHRLLKPGGRLLLTAPFISHLHMEPFHYYSGFMPYWYQFWLPKRGFRIESTSAVGGPGQTCLTFCQAFYSQWSAAEKNLGQFRRIVSLAFRVPAKILVHAVLPRILPKFDPWLGNRVICSTSLVCAVRVSDSK